MSIGSGDTPATFESALESASVAVEAPPVSTPVQESTPAEVTPAAATAQPAGEVQAPVTASAEDPKKEPPAWRWQDILENTRKSVAQETEARIRQEVEQQYQARLKPYEGVDESTLQGYRILRAAEQGDAQARAMVAQAQPQLAQAMGWVRSAPDPMPQPDAAIQLADGSTVPVYTPEGMQKREAWLQKQLEHSLETRLSEKFQPLAQTAETLRQQQEATQRAQQTQQWATDVLAPLKRLPFFDEFKTGISKALSDVPETFAGDLREVVWDTYAKLHAAKVADLEKNGETKALASIQQRAVADTGNPSAASASTPKTFRGKRGTEAFAEALGHFATDAR